MTGVLARLGKVLYWLSTGMGVAGALCSPGDRPEQNIRTTTRVIPVVLPIHIAPYR